MSHYIFLVALNERIYMKQNIEPVGTSPPTIASLLSGMNERN